MLVLTRKTGQKIIIGQDIYIVLVSAGSGKAHIGVQAPNDIRIARFEDEGQSQVHQGASGDGDGGDSDMQVITRRVSEKIAIGDQIEVMLVSIMGDAVRLGINAPREVKIMRMEVLEEVRDQNRQAVNHPAVSEKLKDLLQNKE